MTAETGLFAIFVTNNHGGETMYYTLKDHQGNLTATVCGNTVERLSYDAWGNLRSPETWCVDTTIRPMFDRGYTGHEHLIGFRLINMNGRMYDPVMSSFLSVDRYVQQPETSQGFNRYAYCMYNPLKYVDPSGWMMNRPNGRGGIPPYFAPNAQPVSVNGGYQLSEIDGVLYGGCLRDVDVTAFAITSSGDMPSNHLSEWSSDRGFGNYGHIDGTLSNSEIKPYTGGSGLGSFWQNGYNNNSSTNNVNIDIAGGMINTAGLYTYIEKIFAYSEMIGKWTDKMGNRRPLTDNGNQYTGGKLNYGKYMSRRFMKASTALNTIGVGLSVAEMSAKKKQNTGLILYLDSLDMHQVAQSLVHSGFLVGGN